MSTIDFKRTFVRVEKGEIYDLESARHYENYNYVFVDWKDLLQEPRTVALAEAAAGKAIEFNRTIKKLRQNNKTAFFVSVEDIVDGGL